MAVVTTDEIVRDALHRQLQRAREALVWKLDGLEEYDVRRPLTPTGTNLLGLVKHVATWEARYLGDCFGRPYPEPLLPWQVDDDSDLWATETETREDVVGLYRRVWAHADATIHELPLDAPGQVPWWPSPEVTLARVLVHLLADTVRHAGHADILREQLDGSTGVVPEAARPADAEARAAYVARVERAARAVRDAGGPAGVGR